MSKLRYLQNEPSRKDASDDCQDVNTWPTVGFVTKDVFGI
jgi:hypothetical protein